MPKLFPRASPDREHKPVDSAVAGGNRLPPPHRADFSGSNPPTPPHGVSLFVATFYHGTFASPLHMRGMRANSQKENRGLFLLAFLKRSAETICNSFTDRQNQPHMSLHKPAAPPIPCNFSRRCPLGFAIERTFHAASPFFSLFHAILVADTGEDGPHIRLVLTHMAGEYGLEWVFSRRPCNKFRILCGRGQQGVPR